MKKELDWVVTKEIENEIEGEVNNSKFIDGKHGVYNLAKGHFYCYDPYPDKATPKEMYFTTRDNYNYQIDRGLFQELDNLRGIVYHINLFDVQSGIFNTITILFEESSAGLLTGSKIEILPFFMPFLGLPKGPITLLTLRGLVVFWHTIATIATLCKRKRFNDLFSEQTFFDAFLAIAVAGMQWANIFYLINLNASFITDYEGMRSDEIRNKPWLLRGFGYRF